jgi:hypothetical protein
LEGSLFVKATERPKLPVVGLIGPTNLDRISRASGIPVSLYEACAKGAAALVARQGAILALVPDRGVALHGAHSYHAEKGPWMIGLIPDGGPSDSVATANCRLNARLCDEVLDGFTWHHQHATLCQLSNLMVCIGLSCGTLTEIAWTKWLKGPRVLAFRSTFASIPAEMLAETDIVMIDDLAEMEERLALELGKPAPAGGPGQDTATRAP